MEMKDFNIGNETRPISARDYKILSAKEKAELKIILETKGLNYDDYIKQSEKLFPRGGKKPPIVWRKR